VELSKTGRGYFTSEVYARTAYQAQNGDKGDLHRQGELELGEAARPVGTDWSRLVAMVMGVAGGTPGTGPTTLFNVLSTKDTMDKT